MDKPAGPTSHDVVAHARRVLGERSIGHTGTLDPFATGLLVLLVGRGTRIARFLDGLDKTYLATARLGTRTTTDDLTGETIEEVHAGPLPDAEAVRAALAGLVGRQAQRPPAYSAKKQGGERAYARARRGETVDLAPADVTVHGAELLSAAALDATFRVTVSTGTYVRALARDLGDVLGVGAHLRALRRESIGGLRVEDAVPLDALESDTPLRPLAAVVSHLPQVALDDAARIDVRHGRRVAGVVTGTVALLADDALIGVAEGDGEWLRPTVVLAAQ